MVVLYDLHIMRTGRRTPALLAVSLIAAPFLGLPGQAAPAAAAARGPGQSLRAETIGGPQLADRGLVFNGGGGVRNPPKVDAKAYIVADVTTGQVLAARDPHGQYLPASALKVLTAVTLIPRLDAERKVKPSQKACNVTGSAVGLRPNWRYSVSDLFHGLMMSSGNDAAAALSEANGGLQETLDQMNAEARRLQALDTEARTPSGLNEGITVREQHSSAYDLALIAKEGLRNRDFRRYIGATAYKFPAPPTKRQRQSGKKEGGYQIQTHDRLLLQGRWRFPGTIGGKNGWTLAAQATFVGAANRDGHTIVISLMHAQPSFWGDAKDLLTWGFAATGKVKPAGTLVEPKPTTGPRIAADAVAPPSRGASPAAADRGGDLIPLAGGAAGMVLCALVGGVWIARRRRARW